MADGARERIAKAMKAKLDVLDGVKITRLRRAAVDLMANGTADGPAYGALFCGESRRQEVQVSGRDKWEMDVFVDLAVRSATEASLETDLNALHVKIVEAFEPGDSLGGLIQFVEDEGLDEPEVEDGNLITAIVRFTAYYETPEGRPSQLIGG